MTSGSLLYAAVLVAAFYFLIIRPQQIRTRDMRALVAALSEGDRVITAGGIHGTVVRVFDQTVLLRVYDNTEIEFEKVSIAKITVDIPDLSEGVELLSEMVDDGADDPA